MQALSDLIVLDLTHMLSGPYAAMLLADLGARTIKIEPPVTGEGTRRLLADDPVNSFKGMGAYFLTLNRNKQSICLDLKQPEGRAIAQDLSRAADVVIDNFSPGVMRRLGLDHETLSAINPRIVTCSISGFGASGPAANRSAFDMVAQGMGGGMSLTGEEGGRPIRAGLPIGDLGGGLFGAIGVLSALHARERSGRGQHVDISMLDAQVSMLNYMATMHLLSGFDPGALGNGHFVHVPYNTFRTRTRDIIIAVITDSFWSRLVEVLGLPALEVDRFATQPGRLAERRFIENSIQKALATQTCEHWLAVLEAVRVPCAPVNDLRHALADPQVRFRDMVVSVEHPLGGFVEMPGNPVKLGGSGAQRFMPPPLLGEHTAAVLGELLRMRTGEIAALKDRGVIA
jgi:crotonobetainyl-CoA:carnitine CoA-transferase CaiB-like acyl-CoA transferase